MPYYYNKYGWYRGEAPPASNADHRRVTNVEPVNKSVAETVGALRSNWTGYAWLEMPYAVPSEPNPLPALRRERWREVKHLRDDKVKNGGIPLNGEWYPSNTDAKALILWVLAIGSNTGQRIELLDGSMANLTVARATDLLAAGATQSAAIMAYADTLKTQIDASGDPASIDITSGWPAVYEPV